MTPGRRVRGLGWWFAVGLFGASLPGIGAAGEAASPSASRPVAATTAGDTRRPVHVAAAESLRPGLSALETAYETAHPDQDLVLRFGPSGVLRDEILKRVPTQIFLSAGEAEMAALVLGGRVAAGTSVVVATNRLMLVTGARGRLRSLSDLAQPRIRHVTLADPATVPLGRYALGALRKAGVWAEVKPKVRYLPSSTAVVNAVERNEADAGIVYASDALGNPRLKAVMGLDSWAPSIPYVAALVLDDEGQPPAEDFLRYLQSGAARTILAEHRLETP